MMAKCSESYHWRHMLVLKCIKTFATRELGYERVVEEGTRWYRHSDRIVHGGYEDVNLLRVDDGRITDDLVLVRIERLSECFEQVPLAENAVRKE